jgi:hypothetical protein
VARPRQSRRRHRSWLAWLLTRRGIGKRWRLVVVALITATSVLAAVGAWRTEAHGSGADERDRDGVAQATAFQREQPAVLLGLVDLVQAYAEFQTARAESNALAESAAKAAPAVAAPLRVAAAAEGQHAVNVFRTLDEDSLTESHLTSQGLERKLRQDLAFQRSAADLDGSDEFAAADAELHKANSDAGFTALAIAAAFLLTLAQVIRRRLAWFFLGLGAAAFAAALVLIVAVEALW